MEFAVKPISCCWQGKCGIDWGRVCLCLWIPRALSRESRLKWGEGLGGTGGWEAQHEPAMCACSPDSQPYPGLHQETRGQQGEGGDSAPLLRSHETPPGVLRPALEPPAQEGHGAVGANPEESDKDDARAGAPILRGQAKRVGADQPGKEKALGRPCSSLPVPGGGPMGKLGKIFSAGLVLTGQGAMALT